jgi:folate-binding protein YgfZ
MPRALARLERFLAARARRRALEEATAWPTFTRPFSAASTTPSTATAADLTAAGARGVLRLRGKGALRFLQGLVTNDMRPLMGPSPSHTVAYAALLTPKGKLIEDVFVHRSPSSSSGDGGANTNAEDEETLLLDVGAASKREALAWLARYRLRRPLALDDVSADFHAWAAWGGGEAPPAAADAADGASWRADPRLPGGALGWRGVFAAADSASSSASSSSASSASASAADHRRLRYALAVPEGAAEMLSAGGGSGGGTTAAATTTPASQQQRAPNPLEFGLDVLNGVSYDKGCYIGQERNSFTHYRGVLRRRAVPVRVSFGGGAASSSSSLAGSPIVDPSDGRPIGTLIAAEGDVGLAHLLLARALPGGEVASPPTSFVVVGGGSGGEAARVVPLGRPAWWPREWGREEVGAGAQEQQG